MMWLLEQKIHPRNYFYIVEAEEPAAAVQPIVLYTKDRITDWEFRKTGGILCDCPQCLEGRIWHRQVKPEDLWIELL